MNEDTVMMMGEISAWATQYNASAIFNGEVGFGRPCAGVIVADQYIDYEWGTGAEPPSSVVDAYHKHNCLCVLHDNTEPGIERAVKQLHDWVTHLIENGFVIVVEDRDPSEYDNFVSLLFHGTTRAVLKKEA